MIRSVSWSTDAHGDLRGVSFHDGTIVGSSVTEAAIVFLVRNTSDDVVKFTLSGVHAFTMRNLCSGAIVGDICVWPSKQVPESEWMARDGVWPVLLKERVTDGGVRGEAQRLVDAYPDALMLQILCSYGGDFAALCDRFDVQETDEDGRLGD
jgi:hypothetical protein